MPRTLARSAHTGQSALPDGSAAEAGSLHDDDDKPSNMGPNARRCRGYCGGWRDPDTFGEVGGFHFQVNVVEPIDSDHFRVHGYWCAGGLDAREPLAIVSARGEAHEIRVVELDPAPNPSWVGRPHLRSLTISAADGIVGPGTCIRSVRDSA